MQFFPFQIFFREREEREDDKGFDWFAAKMALTSLITLAFRHYTYEKKEKKKN